jgi:hypothetical protein
MIVTLWPLHPRHPTPCGSLPESYVAPAPTTTTHEQNSAVPLAGLTAYQGAFQFGGLVAGQTVLVLGASGERTGCRPMVATGNPRRPS